MGGKKLSQIGSHGAVSQSVVRSVNRNQSIIGRKAVSKKRRKEYIVCPLSLSELLKTLGPRTNLYTLGRSMHSQTYT